MGIIQKRRWDLDKGMDQVTSLAQMFEEEFEEKLHAAVKKLKQKQEKKYKKWRNEKVKSLLEDLNGDNKKIIGRVEKKVSYIKNTLKDCLAANSELKKVSSSHGDGIKQCFAQVQPI